jgi:glycosyltransferase involved in cell wall biosynthesis
MQIGLVIYGSLDTMSGGYLYDRKLVAYLRDQGDDVEIISLPWRSYLSHLTDNLHFRLPAGLDILIEDELDHPSLLSANAQPHAYPIVSLIHNLHSSERRPAWQNNFYRAIERRYLRSVDGYIFNSQTTRSAVNPLINGSPSAEDPYIVATPGGDRLGGLTLEEVHRRATGSGPLRLLFLANVTPLKGLDVLLEAVNHLDSDLRVDVIGSLEVDVAYAREMQQFTKAHGLQPRVTFHGVLDGPLLVEKIRQAHVLVIPSFYEGFGIAYLEGMAFGLPAIGTTAGAIPQLISNGETGYLIEPGDSRTLAIRLHELASDRQLLARLSIAALQHFQMQPTWAQSLEAIRNFLFQMIKGWEGRSLQQNS